jgi:tetraprenyl-beta-curcumene synthase
LVNRSALPIAAYGACNPAPLSAAQLQSLARAATRQLLWGLPAASAELRKWRGRAVEIPDQAIRGVAVGALDRKRGNTHGAGMFWTLPRVRNPDLLRLLVTYQVMWDYLDSIGERGATVETAGARQMHLALVDALDPGGPTSDYYRHRPGCGDGGYLCALVHACRQYCLRLPSFQRVRPLLVCEAARVNVQAINHDPNAASRETALREWVARELSSDAGRGQFDEVEWFELAAAAGANMAIYALLGIGAEPALSDLHVQRIRDTYFPWVSAVVTMLDSYVDQREDIDNGDQVYIAHYRTPELATRQVCELIRRSFTAASALPNGERHALIVACMIAMYLSKDSARTREMQGTTRSFLNAGGSLTEILLPILRTWRIAYKQRSA